VLEAVGFAGDYTNPQRPGKRRWWGVIVSDSISVSNSQAAIACVDRYSTAEEAFSGHRIISNLRAVECRSI
jgi:hypothetical protein